MTIINITNPGNDPINGDFIRENFENGSFIEHYYYESINNNTYLHVTYPTLSAVNTQVDLTVSVKFADGSPAPVQSTYYVPIIRLADSKQIAFLTVDFTDGVSNVSFTPAEPGVYIMDTSKIRPIPVSIVVDHPEIIVI